MDQKKRKLKVLIVDDELGMCLGAQKILKKYHFPIDKLKVDVSFDADYSLNGDSALKIIESNPKDLLLLDYKLPDMTGLDILQKLKNLSNPPLVIMITAYATLETAVAATKSGAYDFIAKPFTPEELRDTLKKATTRFILEEEAIKLQEEKKRIRFEFISILAHELKAPINAIEGYLKIFEKKKQDIPLNDLEFMVNRSMIRIQGMRKLIFDLLDMTRIESGEKKRKMTNEDLVLIIKDSIDLHASLIKEMELEVQLDLPTQYIVQVDKTEIEIVFSNLISNAIKYNKKKGKVFIQLTKLNESTTFFEVADTGIGIAEEDQNRLFNDFIRIKNEWTTHITGSGLGLSTVKKIVELYKGSVSVSGQYGVGSRFTVKLNLEGNKKEIS